jgi:hypothetical protein
VPVGAGAEGKWARGDEKGLAHTMTYAIAPSFHPLPSAVHRLSLPSPPASSLMSSSSCPFFFSVPSAPAPKARPGTSAWTLCL